ncbi:hypothetical protein D9V30_10360 [Mycetocola reblochoni]|uniref:ERF family protein n=2 Tax=Mycetocola reblochoni TaxID=331618 RepID=A0A1R4JPN0_9MICO|nr:ERF family protein [Mycetocola reblochoni]RLP68383.1 hypothetical protein D9V30_10360 [Mycetocola reblochoni]SJN33932.1 ERF family protein [Mycetocola reblochoni REB411]
MGKHETLAAALAAFQMKIPNVAKGQTADVRSKNGASYKYDYADLSDVTAAVLPLLAAEGLAWVTVPTFSDDGRWMLEYQLLHESGQSIPGVYPLPDPTRTGPQDMGGAITYARRYALCAVTGVAPGGDDDDAGSAQRAGATSAPPPVQAPAAPPEPPADWQDRISAATSQQELGQIYTAATSNGWMNDHVFAALTARKQEVTSSGSDEPADG